jgi:putative transposase
VARHTAFRFTLDVSPAQAAVLRRYVGAARFAYNQCLALVREGLDARSAGEDVRVPWTGFDLINAFNAWKRSARAGRVFAVDGAGTATVVATGLSWRTEVCQLVFEEAAVDLGRALAAFAAARRGQWRGAPGEAGQHRRRGGVGFPRFRRRRDHGSFRVRQKTAGGRASIRLGEDAARSVRLPGIGVVRVREDTRRLRRMLAKDRARILSATIAHRAGRWTVSLQVEAADLHPAHRHPSRPEPPDVPGAGWVGVDRGLSAFTVAATGDGRQVLRVDDAPRALRAAQDRLRRLNRALARTRKRSRHRATVVGRLSRAHARVANVRRHFLHQVANQLVKTHDQLALEDLHVAGMLRNRRLAGAIADAGWADLARIIGYKQAWRGGQLVLVDRWYPSTKTCSTCRTVTPTVPLSQRVFTCTHCGHSADRDLNAAINLAVWAEQNHAQTRDPQAGGPVTNACRETVTHPRQPA